MSLLSHIESIRSAPRRTEEVQIYAPDGTVTGSVKLAAPRRGSALADILYPDPQEFAQAPVHYAVANDRRNDRGEIDPYPPGLLSDVIAIELTIVTEGDPVQRATLYELYDADYGLFTRLLTAAMRVSGLITMDSKANSGEAAWDQVLKLTRLAIDATKHGRHGESREHMIALMAVVTAALKDYKRDVEPDDGLVEESDRDPGLETILGNSVPAQ